MQGNKGTIKYDRLGNRLYFLGGKMVPKHVFDEAFPPKELGVCGGHLPSCWPMTSVALAVHPKQVKEANEVNRKKGIAVSYTPDGTAVIADRAARKAIIKEEGFFDKGGGYGD